MLRGLFRRMGRAHQREPAPADPDRESPARPICVGMLATHLKAGHKSARNRVKYSVNARGLILLSMLAFASGCNRHPNADCRWPPDNGSRSLYYDAEFAEDLAIRYADAHTGPRSGHFEGFAQYGRTRDQCMASLFAELASRHSVAEDQVRAR